MLDHGLTTPPRRILDGFEKVVLRRLTPRGGPCMTFAQNATPSTPMEQPWPGIAEALRR